MEQRKEDKMASDFAKAQQDLQEHEMRQQALNEHKAQYMQDVMDRGRAGVDIQQMNRFQAFIGKLDQACSLQANKVTTARKVVDQRRALWLNQQRKRKAIEALIDKQKQAMQLAEQRAEQKMFDEFAMQQFVRKQLT
ncbi:flagellar export protein FliJ [Saccharobesus litoralis]|uniref:Flagellar FliJ protein n=2 Tax=Saccharobesus litoralis TaxID=2172099 RepID=A0A2S0VXR5_9ALTE|nr:flagellar export protein FliJ [Saccharobesus litoralis]